VVYRKVVAVVGPEVDVAPTARSLTEQVYDHLLELILNAELRPGSMVLEPSLASYFGVSKTPVREALRMLTHDGWVVTIPRKGYLIKPLQLADVSEVFGLRMMIEPALFAEAARQASADNIAKLRAQVERQGDESASLSDSLQAAREFHLLGAALSRNRRAGERPTARDPPTPPPDARDQRTYLVCRGGQGARGDPGGGAATRSGCGGGADARAPGRGVPGAGSPVRRRPGGLSG
jgi:DNA-binding transcriptional regulator YhcF (GntR family)